MLLSNIVTSVNKGNIQHTIFILELDIRTPLCGGDNISFLGQKKNKMGMVVCEFLFLVTKSLKSRRLNLSRIMRFVCKISLSLLETRENIFGFLFSSRNWRKCLKFLHFFGKNSRSLLEPENRSRHFSFLFSKLEMWIPYFSFSSRFDFLATRQYLP